MKNILLLLLIGIFIFPSSAPLHAGENHCVACHQTLTDARMKQMYEKWNYSPHQMAGVSCDHCHGGDPESPEKEAAHKECYFGDEKRERTSLSNINKMCGDCHGEIYEAFQQSNHFKTVEAGIPRPHCGNCHYAQEGRILNHSQIGDFCRDCHKMSTKQNQFFMANDAGDFLDFSERARKSIAVAEKMLHFQRSLKNRTVPGEDLELAEKLIGISRDAFHEQAVLWHRFDPKNISQFSRKAYYLAQTAIDLLLPGKSGKTGKNLPLSH